MEEAEAKAPTIIAIDGPAGAGKSVVARLVAKRLRLPYIDTGAMYRAVALFAIREGIDLADAEGLSRLAGILKMDFVGDENGGRLWVSGEFPGDALRTSEVSQGASKASVVAGVRAAMTEEQRRLGRARGCVMEGRDIGTVVFPDASVKVFLTASLKERARRRAAELVQKGMTSDEAVILNEIAERDRRDAERDLAPMKPAPDAVILDTDDLTIEEAADRIAALTTYGGRG